MSKNLNQLPIVTQIVNDFRIIKKRLREALGAYIEISSKSILRQDYIDNLISVSISSLDKNVVDVLSNGQCRI